MSGEEIKERIEKNNEEIQRLINGNFVLNKDILRLLDDNKKLREECPHEFVNHICKFCNSGEEK